MSIIRNHSIWPYKAWNIYFFTVHYFRHQLFFSLHANLAASAISDFLLIEFLKMSQDVKLQETLKQDQTASHRQTYTES